MKITEIFITIMLITILVGADVAYAKRIKASSVDQVKPQLIVEATPAPTASPIPTDIVGYINYKFGTDAPKAFLLLQGNGAGSCAENRNLNPEAINRNTDWGGVGADRGYWQINDVYHPSVSDACAKDVECSTNYAFRMYQNDGKTFKRWTCGREYGI